MVIGLVVLCAGCSEMEDSDVASVVPQCTPIFGQTVCFPTELEGREWIGGSLKYGTPGGTLEDAVVVLRHGVTLGQAVEDLENAGAYAVSYRCSIVGNIEMAELHAIHSMLVSAFLGTNESLVEVSSVHPNKLVGVLRIILDGVASPSSIDVQQLNKPKGYCERKPE